MRIIGGRFGGRRLASFKADHIRPTTDRVKESLFNIIGQILDGQRVLDLYSGTGNLSIEALSRGATYVEAVEKHPKSLSIIRKNLEDLGISKSIRVIQSDVFSYIKKFRGDAFDLILIDPPFTEKLADSTMEEISRSRLWQANTLIVIESSAQETIGDTYLELVCIDRRSFGDKMLSIFQPRAKDVESDISR